MTKFEDMTKKQKKIVLVNAKQKALEKAGDILFSEHSSDYKVEDVTIIDENK